MVIGEMGSGSSDIFEIFCSLVLVSILVEVFVTSSTEVVATSSTE